MSNSKEHFVSIVGAGKLAMHLAPALDNVGFSVREVYSRDETRARALIAKLYGAEIRADLDFSQSSSRIFILSVSDDAIGEMASQIILPPEAGLVHAAGSGSPPQPQRSSAPHISLVYPLHNLSTPP